MPDRAWRMRPAAAAGLAATLVLHLAAGLGLVRHLPGKALPQADQPLVLSIQVVPLPAASGSPEPVFSPVPPSVQPAVASPLAGAAVRLPVPPAASAITARTTGAVVQPSEAGEESAMPAAEGMADETAAAAAAAADMPAGGTAVEAPPMPVLPPGWGWRSAELRRQPDRMPPDCRQGGPPVPGLCNAGTPVR